MGSQFGTSGAIIANPTGGGAVRGLGETFAPDLFTGTGNFTVPIALPPGRNGFQPDLKLVYSTGHGNGMFGLGWNLSAPNVARKTSKGVPVYDDDRDTFLLSGAEDLVPVARPDAATVRYRPRTEGLFARIDHRCNERDNYWEVRTKDGLTSYYGTPRPPGVDPAWRDPAVIVDPFRPERVFAWELTATEDPFGNRIEYEYLRDDSDGPQRFGQLYLHRCRYVDVPEGGRTRFLVTVTFMYAERPDPFSVHRSGFEVRTRLRCTRIEVHSNADQDRLVRAYELIYLDQRPNTDHSSANGVSLLTQVRVIGDVGNGPETMPPLELGYTAFEPQRRTFAPVTGELPARSLAASDLDLVDLSGNGLPDILEMNGTTRYWRNAGGGRFDAARALTTAPAGIALGQPGVHVLDADGDGRADLVVTTPTLSGHFPLRLGDNEDVHTFRPYRTAPTFPLDDPQVRLVDLDGDGVTDALRCGAALECFFSDPREGWRRAGRAERRPIGLPPDISFSDPRLRLADMTGDGLQDIVLVADGNVEYWPNLGHGNWGARVSMRNGPRFPDGYNSRQILLGDVDGDGVADLVFVDHRRVLLWLNRGGNAWGEPIVIDGTPPLVDADAIRLVDLYGTGVGGVLWSRDADDAVRPRAFFLDFTGGAKPYLLARIDNHMGSETLVEYASSTRDYLRDEASPTTRWQGSLPFPVQVVARVEVRDHFSHGKLVTEYAYHHGHWDGTEREFRGFGRVDRRDTEVFQDYRAADSEAVPPRSFAPPVETRTWFHLGPVGDEFGTWEEPDFADEFWPGDPNVFSRPAEAALLLARLPRRARRDAVRALRGRVLRAELYARDSSTLQGRPYTVEEHLYNLREESPPPAGEERPRIFFAHARAMRSTRWERGTEPLTRFTFADDYDAYGQPRSQTQVAVPRGRDFHLPTAGEAYLVTQTETTYALRNDAQRYIADRVARTTTYEVTGHGRDSIWGLWAAVIAGTAARQVIGQRLTYYDGPEWQGLPFGQVGNYGAPVRTEALVLTRSIVRDAYRSGGAVLPVPEEPPYLDPAAPAVAWTDEYPQGFRAVRPLAGFRYEAGGPGSEHAAGYFATVERRRYDFHVAGAAARGLVRGTRDPLGFDTAVDYDHYDLLPTRVTDAAGLVTQAVYDYRTFQPAEVTDPNGNRTSYAFNAFGLLEAIAVMGRPAQPVGDTPQVPGTRLVYDFGAFTRDSTNPQPVSVRTIRRLHHHHDVGVPAGERDHTIETIEYSDGFGRLLQARAAAEDVRFGDVHFGDANLPADFAAPVGAAIGRAPAAGNPPGVVVTGWQVYDNKGCVVEKYEPFFSTGWAYAPPADAQFGQRATLSYDPLGRVVRTVSPDGSEERTVHGEPPDLRDPDTFAPSPWVVYTYDANDNAGRTHPNEAAGYQRHWDTPAAAVLDALGRTVTAVARNGPDPVADRFVTHSAYDIRGNLLRVTDPLGRECFRTVYDLANNPLRRESLDGGVHRTVLDAAGNPLESRDTKGGLILNAYDDLHRHIRQWARDRQGEAITLRQYVIFGDSPGANLTPAQLTDGNLRGKRYRHHDEAGRVICAAYDFKGNARSKTRHVISDAAMLQVQPFLVDWQPPAGQSLADRENALLEPAGYVTTTTYDALNRVRTVVYPRGAELRPEYNRAGALQAVRLDGVAYVRHIAYNAKGQRTLIAYGNGLMTRYAYDPHTFRLARARTERYETTAAAPLTFQPVAPNRPLLDSAYAHDLAGNLLRIDDRTPGGGVRNNPDAQAEADPALRLLLGAGDALIRRFEYDPLYRLTSATGRECGNVPAPRPWDDAPRCGYDSGNHGTPNQDNAPDLTRRYRESYVYDPAGNLVELHHQNGVAWVRHFGVGGLAPAQWQQEWPNHLGGVWPNPPGNRLTHVGDNNPGVAQTHFFDPNGNLERENGARHFEWDHTDRLRAFRNQLGMAPPTVEAHYLYDAGGQRVKKLVRRGAGVQEVTVYVDGIFEHHRLNQAGVGHENFTLHVMDNQKRIATIRDGAAFPGDNGPAVQYHLGDHLGSTTVVVNDAGDWVNREEYTPYGETAFGGFARKRYRFQGKERDAEHGLCYQHRRYYAPWLARWLSSDPAGDIDGCNLYIYVRNSPLVYVDPHGTSAEQDVNNLKSELQREAQRTQNLERRRLKLIDELADAQVVVEVREQRLGDIPDDITTSSVENQVKRVEKAREKVREIEEKIESTSKEIKQSHERRKKLQKDLDRVEKRAAKEKKNKPPGDDTGGSSSSTDPTSSSTPVNKQAKKAAGDAGSGKTAKKILGPLAERFIKWLPFLGAAYTIGSADDPVAPETLGRAVAGEIGIGPFDAEMGYDFLKEVGKIFTDLHELNQQNFGLAPQPLRQ
jgi:RHS repeat-associated protein